MKKIKYKLLTVSAFALIASVVIGGCKRVTTDDLNQTPITIDAAVDGEFGATQNAMTKLGATGFEEGDQISFFAVKYTAGVPNVLGADANSTYINNALYQRSGGFFKHFDGTDYIRSFFPTDGSSVDIYGLYPNTSTVSSFTAYSFKIIKDQKSAATSFYNSDLMMAKTAAITPQPVPQRLVFHHLLSKIEINVKSKNFPAGVDITDLQFVNILPEAVVDLTTFNGTSATVAPGSTAATEVDPMEITPQIGFAKAYTAIIPAQKFAKGAPLAKITLNTVNNDVYVLKLSDDFTMEVGKKHLFEVTVDFGIKDDIYTTAQIVPWTYTNLDGGAVDRESEYKFKVVLLNERDLPQNTKSVKVGVNGNRTFHLTKIEGYTPNAEAGKSVLKFAFPGEWNRPGEATGGVLFTVNRLELVNENGVTFNTCKIDPVINVTSKGEMTLYYDMAASTIKPTNP